MWRFGAVCVYAASLAALSIGQAQAGATFQLKKGLRWLVPAETADLDEAIGIAQHFSDQHTLIVRTAEGKFDVVVGPFRAATVSELLRKYSDMPSLPGTARLATGQNFVETVWTPTTAEENPSVARLVEIKPGKAKTIIANGLTVTLSLHRLRAKTYELIASGSASGKPEFSVNLGTLEGEGSSLFDGQAVEAGLARLDGSTTAPQVVLTHFTGGAHCCTETWILTKPAGAQTWQTVSTGMRDGSGFAFEDVDGDGAMEMIGIDNSFLYSFDSYADSYAPVQYFRLVGTNLADVSLEEPFRKELKRDLAYIEFDAKSDPQRWRSNGYLAAWVASKIRLGQGDDAWNTMLENYTKDNGFGFRKCLSGEEVDQCPEANLVPVPFPKALADSLQEWGYGPLPQTALSAAE